MRSFQLGTRFTKIRPPAATVSDQPEGRNVTASKRRDLKPPIRQCRIPVAGSIVSDRRRRGVPPPDRDRRRRVDGVESSRRRIRIEGVGSTASRRPAASRRDQRRRVIRSWISSVKASQISYLYSGRWYPDRAERQKSHPHNRPSRYLSVIELLGYDF